MEEYSVMQARRGRDHTTDRPVEAWMAPNDVIERRCVTMDTVGERNGRLTVEHQFGQVSFDFTSLLFIGCSVISVFLFF